MLLHGNLLHSTSQQWSAAGDSALRCKCTKVLLFLREEDVGHSSTIAPKILRTQVTINGKVYRWNAIVSHASIWRWFTANLLELLCTRCPVSSLTPIALLVSPCKCYEWRWAKPAVSKQTESRRVQNGKYNIVYVLAARLNKLFLEVMPAVISDG